jgi:hypothetical protein
VSGCTISGLVCTYKFRFHLTVNTLRFYYKDRLIMRDSGVSQWRCVGERCAGLLTSCRMINEFSSTVNAV